MISENKIKLICQANVYHLDINYSPFVSQCRIKCYSIKQLLESFWEKKYYFKSGNDFFFSIQLLEDQKLKLLVLEFKIQICFQSHCKFFEKFHLLNTKPYLKATKEKKKKRIKEKKEMLNKH